MYIQHKSVNFLNSVDGHEIKKKIVTSLLLINRRRHTNGSNYNSEYIEWLLSGSFITHFYFLCCPRFFGKI
jgi:hypothetical protein